MPGGQTKRAAKKARTEAQASLHSISQTGEFVTQATNLLYSHGGMATPTLSSPHLMYCTPPSAPPPGQPQFQSYPQSLPQTHFQLSPTSQLMGPQGGWLHDLIYRLDKMDEKLGSLARIENSVTAIVTRVDNLEGKFAEVEKGMNFLSAKFDEQSVTNASVKNQIEDLAKQLNDNKSKSVREDIQNLSDSVVDLRTRSMRDNLLFKGFPECHEGQTEDTEMLIKHFIRTELGIDRDLSFVRVHRLGKRERGETARVDGKDNRKARDDGADPVAGTSGDANEDTAVKQTIDGVHRSPDSRSRPRHIVARFELFKDRELVRNEASNLFNDLKNKGIFVDEHFPIEVERRRRILYPIRSAAFGAGDDVKLVVDKLYINNQLYFPGQPLPRTRCFELRVPHDPDVIRNDRRRRAIGYNARKRGRQLSTTDDMEQRQSLARDAPNADETDLMAT